MNSGAFRIILLALLFGLFVRDASAQASRWAFRDGSNVKEEAGVTLPAGAEIGRTLSGDPVGVRVVSKPYFSATPNAWPMISIAGATLTFSRDGAGGGVILVGDSMLPLPLRVELDVTGRSLVPVDVTMTVSQSQSVARVAIPGQPPAEVKTTVPAGPVALTIAAGAAEGWQIDLLEEIPPAGSVGTEIVPADGGTGATKDTPKTTPETKSPGQLRKEAFAAALEAYGKKESLAAVEEKLAAGIRQKKGTFGWYTESAHELMRVALALREKRDYELSEKLIARALEVLTSGDQLLEKASAAERGRRYHFAGEIYGTILGNTAEARRNFEEAARLDPTAQLTKTALARLEVERVKTERVNKPSKQKETAR